MLKRIIAITAGIATAFVLTSGMAFATEPAYMDYEGFLIQDCPENPEYPVHCDKIVFHIKNLGRFFCPPEVVKQNQFQNPHDQVEFGPEDWVDIRIMDDYGKINNLRAIAATYLNERGCRRAVPNSTLFIVPDNLEIETVDFITVKPMRR
ncbi:hypothetical protein [Candidatus Entotheonella palauensis]|uniref:Uncharacterized protein n=1 Tax=Candidatus Entotheonella gemina TaxID=1429439 RepID=W4M100_9BACT|nr:hypothetical protein [Candidatus Entotheonella palauensis]ETX03661.1 MAG: hypothetical protein ETSY2_32855 [Candidatus Entotheonella gemina]